MDQAIQGDHSSAPPGLPLKRKRGRPRKDQTVNRMAIAPVPPGFGGFQTQPRNADSTDDVSDGMVGQAVTGVVEAAFDAGYLLSVRIGNSNTNLRGVVFKPGHYLPVTAENDVAPHVQMIRRNEMHIHGNNRSRMQNGLSSSNQLHGLAQQTTNKASSKGKHAAASTAMSVPPFGTRGNVVPVVLQPPNTSNGTHQAPRDTSPDLDDDEVHTVEPLAMLPPDVLAPTRHVAVTQNQPLPPQSYAGQQVPQGNTLHGNSSFNEATKAGQEKEGKAAKVAEIHIPDEPSKGHQGSSPASEMHNKDNREAYKSLPEESNMLQQQPFQAVHSGLQQSVSVSQPLKNYPTGRMTELLLALQENLTEKQAPHVKHPSSGSGADNAAQSRD